MESTRLFNVQQEGERGARADALLAPEPKTRRLAEIDIREERAKAREEIIGYARALADGLRGKEEQDASGADCASVKEDILRYAETARSSMQKITVQNSDPVMLEFAVEAIKAETQALETGYKSEVVRPEVIGLLRSSLTPPPSEDTLEKFECLREITIDAARVGYGKLALAKKLTKRHIRGQGERESGAENYVRSIGTALDSKLEENAKMANRILQTLLHEPQDETRRTEAGIALHALFAQALNFGLTLDKNFFGFRDPHGGRRLTQAERERLLSTMDAQDSVKTRISQAYEGLYALESWAETIGDSLDALGPQGRTDSANAAWQFLTRHKKPILIGLASLIALGGAALIVHYLKNADHAPTDDGISPDAPDQSGVSPSPSIDSVATPQQKVALAPETRLTLNPMDAAKENFTNFIANTAATAGLESQIAPYVDSVRNTVLQKAETLAKTYIAEFGFPKELEQRMARVIITYCEEQLIYHLKNAPTDISDELLLEKQPSDALKHVFQRFENYMKSSAEEFEISAEGIAFFHNTVITKNNASSVRSYQSQLRKVRDLLSDALPRNATGAAVMGGDTVRDFQKKMSIERFDERDFPPVVSSKNAEAVKEAERELELYGLAYAYTKKLQFDAESYPTALSLSNKERVVSLARSLLHEFSPGQYTTTNLTKSYLESITFDQNELPTAIDADFSNIGSVIDAALALGGRPSPEFSLDNIETKLQEKYIDALSFPAFQLEGSEKSLQGCYEILKKLSNALAARGLTGYEFPLMFHEKAHKNITVAGQIPVTAETAEYLSLLIYHYLGWDFKDHYIIGNKDAAIKNPIVYEFSPRDFPLEWNWDDLSFEKLVPH